MPNSREQTRHVSRLAPWFLLGLLAAIWPACAQPAAAPPAPAPVAAAPATPPAYPTTTISQGPLTLTLLTPDPDQGFYQGLRFDYSGIVLRATLQAPASGREHVLFGPFRARHDPKVHDNVAGTAEEIGMETPLGYQDAKPGETFLKIGVGELEKANDQPYGFNRAYKLVKPAQWQITRADHHIDYRTQASLARGWGYSYTKTLALPADAPGRFTITRTLKNTGTQPIETDHYGHNFVCFDNQPTVGPQHRLEFNYALKTERFRDQGVAKVDGKTVSFSGELGQGKAVWGMLNGFATAADNQVTITDTKSKLSLSIQGDTAPSKVVLFALNPCVCPEFFTPIKLAPGQEMTWTTTYTFRAE